MEKWTNEEKASYILSATIDEEDYARAKEEARQIELDPELVEHYRPVG